MSREAIGGLESEKRAVYKRAEVRGRKIIDTHNSTAGRRQESTQQTGGVGWGPNL